MKRLDSMEFGYTCLEVNKMAISLTDLKLELLRVNATWTAKPTAVSLLSDARKRLMLGVDIDWTKLAAERAMAPVMGAIVGAPPPIWDWRFANNQNRVTSVKDQGLCSSCVSFACCGVLEATARISVGYTIDLSEADLHFCSAHGATCGGWSASDGLDAATVRGVVDEASFPYLSAFTGGPEPTCTVVPDRQFKAYKAKGKVILNTAAERKAWIANHGPVVASFHVYDDFYSVGSGVYHHVTGAEAGYHAVAIIGYSDIDRCWIAKNSWGPTFGENGFFRIAYGECGIDAESPDTDSAGRRLNFPMYGITGLHLPEARYPDWLQLDANPASLAIAADADKLYQLHKTGRVWRYTGVPNTGWEELDSNPATVAIAAAGGNLYQLHNNGRIWKYTGVPHSGWQQLDANPATVAIVADGQDLYQLHRDGRIWKYNGVPNTGWDELDNNSETTAIVASGGNLYQLHQSGRIWKYTGTPHTGWQQLDGNAATVAIVADGSELYQKHRDGRIWKYNGVPNTGWDELDNNQATREIAASAGQLFQIHNTGAIWIYTGTPHTGWKEIDGNGESQSICSSGGRLYQMHKSGRIWAYTGL
ncbi:C1 family peptidase [Pseudomonas sp. NPDC089569]|uniref:C1 family peptidase n=1 Tax=Pseudomonas sp. NPDC089569 TaxID=3390722 RepID=UPI003D02CF6D